MIPTRVYPDGAIEVRASGNGNPPDSDPALQHTNCSTLWARRDDGPWLLIPGERSRYAALARLANVTSAAEAIAVLCPQLGLDPA